MHAELRAAVFNTAEAEQASGCLGVTQREWRRRGFLRKQHGLVSYSVIETAELMVMDLLARRGIGPSLSRPLIPLCARGLLYVALARVEAYTADAAEIFCWDAEGFAAIEAAKRKRDAAADRLMADPSEANRAALLAVSGPGWADQAEWLRQRFWAEFALPSVLPMRFLVWWAAGEPSFHPDVTRAYDDLLSSDPKVAGASVVLDLHALATVLLARIPRPLVCVEIVGRDLTPPVLVEAADVVAPR